MDFPGIWNAQGANAMLESSIAVVSGVVNEDIIRPQAGISNIFEWCKREVCWTRIQARIEDVEKLLPSKFYDQLLSIDDQAAEDRSAKQTQLLRIRQLA